MKLMNMMGMMPHPIQVKHARGHLTWRHFLFWGRFPMGPRWVVDPSNRWITPVANQALGTESYPMPELIRFLQTVLYVTGLIDCFLMISLESLT
jgi:hypothetical protein